MMMKGVGRKDRAACPSLYVLVGNGHAERGSPRTSVWASVGGRGLCFIALWMRQGQYHFQLSIVKNKGK